MLNEANIFEQANVMIRGYQSNEEKNKIKALFIEALIDFLTIYAESEIGNVEVNIPLVSLYVNSPEFENVDCFHIEKIEDIYKMIEIEVLMGLPIWRFLKLSDYQFNLFEKNYEVVLKENQKYLMDNYPCKGCLYFKEDNSSFGYVSMCMQDEFSRGEHIDWTKITKCKKCLNFKNDLSSFNKFRTRHLLDKQKKMKELYEGLNIEKLDRYKISLKDIEDSNIPLEVSYSSEDERMDLILQDFALAFKNKRTKSERREEIKRALYLEGFIEFINLYIANEVGSNFKVDISKVVLYLDEIELDFKSKEELFISLEEMIIDGFDFTQFIKRI